MDKIAKGKMGEDAVADAKGDVRMNAEPAIAEDVGLEPPVPEFVLDLPNISNIDV